ncbi:DUF58 domain-containing protein [Caballeronia sp. LjRoot29]|uniref:DUF58 domain-containing protein n=1 Tax=Caballeronia sp. LjRoot29 TaxID=3342315 RepID=UPI003ECD1D2E
MNTLSAMPEFHYRLPMCAGGSRPGSHPGSSFGAGQAFAMHARLFDHPDPRRIDLRASLRAIPAEWLVRVHLQRVSVPVYVVIDVSASMHFGQIKSKLDVAADFVAALGYSAFRAGDQVGMLAFDAAEREELYSPARYGQGVGDVMAATVRRAAQSPGVAGGIDGLEKSVAKLAGRQGIVFIVSDFHWPLQRLPKILDTLTHAYVIPMVVWDRAEVEPPEHGALLAIDDAETGERRTLWLQGKTRRDWRDAAARRRAEIDRLFDKRGIRPFYLQGEFNAESLSRYFLEAVA